MLDGSKHSYQMTFPAGQLPPVNAFWSITMYDGRTQLLIDNPIHRYLINSPMLPGLKKNPDGSLTIYVQKDSPGKDKESNWLPAPNGPMFVVMRLYWPKTEAPSVFPLGKGTWQPPALVPVQNLNALDVKRFGDKSLENFIRTDTRYGHDGLFQGPRGWGYWNYLEYPRPIQNPNLWPDMQSTYFIGRLAMPAGASLTLNYSFPHARYFQFALYKQEHGTFVSIGEDLSGPQIEPDPGSTNPFRVGADRLAEKRDFTLRILAEDAPADAKARGSNTLYVGRDGGELMFVNRTYLSDQGSDGAGWGSADTPATGGGLPTYTGMLADGTKLSAAEVVEQFGRPMEAPKPPVTAEQWDMLVNAKDNDPTLDPATAPARKDPKWEKYWNIKYSILGSFKTPEERAKIPYAGAIDGGGDPETEYMLVQLSRKFGPVYVMRGKMPSFPNTYAGASGKGLEVMPAAQTQYWSLVSCEAMPSGPDRRCPDRHAGAAGQGRQLHHRLQPQGGPAGQRDGRERRGLDRMEPPRRGHRRAEEPTRLRHADAALHRQRPGLGAEPEPCDQARHGGGRDGALLPARRLHHQGGVRGRRAENQPVGCGEERTASVAKDAVRFAHHILPFCAARADPEGGSAVQRQELACEQGRSKDMKKSTIVTLVVGALIVAALVVGYRLFGTVIGAKVERRVARIGLTPNQVAANGPLPGDVSLYAKELACQQKIPTPGYYSVAERRRDLRQRAQRDLPLRQLPRLARRRQQRLRLAQRRRLPGHLLHQQPQAGRALHRRRRVPDRRGPEHGRALRRQGRCDHRQGDLAHLSRQPERLGPLDRQRQPQHPPKRQHRLRLVEPDRR